MARKNFYAYLLADSQGITTRWSECERIVHGRPARFKGFVTREEAEAWLRAGAPWGRQATLDIPPPPPPPAGPASRRAFSAALFPEETPRGRRKALKPPLDRPPQTPRITGQLPEDAIFFDSGTGRGNGTEVNVTDSLKTPLAHLVVSEGRVTRFGTVLLSPGRTNNYGELLACLLALRVARKLGRKLVCGDSRVVLDYWSRDLVKREMRESGRDFARLVEMTVAERAAFEAEGGELRYVPGGVNPADLGFHS